MSKIVVARVRASVVSRACEFVRSMASVSASPHRHALMAGGTRTLARLAAGVVFASLPMLSHASAASFMSGPTLSASTGLVSPGGTFTASVASVSDATGGQHGEAVVQVELREVNGAGYISRGDSFCTPSSNGKDIGDGVNNDPCNSNISFAFPAGQHVLYLTATLASGATTDSGQMTLVVNTNAPPTVSIASPANGSTVQVAAGQSTTAVTLTGASSQSFPSVDHTVVLLDGAAWQTLTGASASAINLSVTVPAGSHTIGIQSFNTLGLSSSASVGVLANRPPVVALSAPATGGTLTWAGSAIPIAVTGTASDADAGDAVTTVLLVNGVAQATLTGAAATSINTSYTVTAAGTCQFQLRSSDTHGGVTLSNVSTVVVDTPPTVSMTSPTAGAVFQTTGTTLYSMTVTGTGTDADGAVANLQLLVDGASVATGSGASMSTSYALAAGTHSVQLRATDNRGLTTTTAPVSVMVNRAPTVSMTAPAAGVLTWNGTSVSIAISGTASDADAGDSISKTEVLVNGSSVQTLTGAAATGVSASYLAAAAGTYQLQLRSTDTHGGVTTTAPVAVTLDVPPTMSMTAPVNGATLQADPNVGTSIAVAGSAGDSDGSVASIQLIVDSSVVTTVNAASISTQVAVGLGSHTVQLRAIDNLGNMTRSVLATVNVVGSAAMLSLPQVATAKAGSIQGQADVSAGKATYGVSVAVPPGVNGMVPSVSLNYGGGTDLGLLGVGWSLSADSKIERCPPTIVQDGVIDTVRLTNADRLCLDGKRLVLATQLPTGCAAGSGTWPGCFNDAYWSPGAQYRTEVESLTKVVASGLGFIVYTKDDDIHYYGDVADSPDTDSGAAPTWVFSFQRMGLPTVQSGSSSTSGTTQIVHTWALRETVDRFGNAIDYTYVRDTVSGEFFLRYIRYGANVAGSQAHFAKVQFDYGARNDADVFYIAGGRADRTVRLNDITTYTDTNADGSGGIEALQYTVNYDYSPSSGRSRVTSLVLCSATPGDCLPATTFKYGEPLSVTPGFTDRGTWSGPVLEDATNAALCSTTISASPDCNYAVSDMFISADFDGDGVTDLITKFPRLDGTLPITLYRNTGNGFIAQPVQFNGATIDKTYYVVLTGDFDGDGQTDLLLAHRSATATGWLNFEGAQMNDWQVCYSRLRQGGGFECHAWAEAGSGDAKLYTVYDFDGDGRDDVYFSGAVQLATGTVTSGGTQRMCLSTGTGFTCSTLVNKQSQPLIDLGSGLEPGGVIVSPQPTMRLTTDIDGDGHPDLLGFVNPYRSCPAEGGGCPQNLDYEDTGVWARSYSNQGAPYGTANLTQLFDFEAMPQFPPPSPTMGMSGSAVSGDLNGDGYSDIVVLYKTPTATSTLVAPNYVRCQGTGQFAGATCTPLTFPGQTVTADQYPDLTFIGDYDADGLDKLWTGSSCTLRGTATTTTASCGTAWTVPSFPAGTPSWSFAVDVESTHVDWLDFTGNGLSDRILYSPGGHWHIYTPTQELGGAGSPVKPGEAIDRMTLATNGLGKQTQFVYALPGDANVYAADATDHNGAVMPVSYPERRIPRMGVLVSAMKVDNGQGGWNEVDYKYYAASRDLQGRGNLGFSRVDKKDVTRGITSTQWFGKTWPNIGVVTYSSTSDVNGLMSTVSQTPAVAVVPLFNDGTSNGQPAWQANGLSTVCPYVGSKTDTEYDNGPEASATTTVVNSLDAWCNPTSVTATVSGDGNSYPTTTSTNFTNDTGHWLMGEATQVAVTKTRGSSVIIRTTAATFDPTTGALATTTVEPSDPTTGLTLKLVTTYDRTKSDGTTPNPFGLLRKTTQTWQHPIKNVAVTRVAKQVTAWDARNRFEQTVQNALAQATTTLHDDRNGAPTSHTDLNGLVTTQTTDAFGQDTTIDDPEGNEHRHNVRACDASCPAGATSIVIDDSLHNNGGGSFTRIAPPTLTYRDDAGRVLRTQTWGFDGRVIVTDSTYDSLGRKYQDNHPRFTSDPVVLAATYLYDDRDRVTSSTVYGETGDARTTTTTILGRQTTVTNPVPATMVEVRDALGLLATATDANSQVTTYARDAFGNLAQVTDPLGDVVKMTYDTRGRRLQLTDPDLGLITTTTDAAGRVLSSVSPKERAAGQSTTMTFDLLDRMVERVEPDLHGKWTYDPANGVGELGQEVTLTGTNTPDVVRTFTYDTLARPSTVVLKGEGTSTNYTTTSTYDPWGRPLTTQAQRDGGVLKVFTTGYNPMGFAQSLTNAAGKVLWTSTTQDAADREVTASYGNSTGIARVYDPHTGRLSASTLRVGTAGQVRFQEANTYDVIGNMSTRSGQWDPGQPDTHLYSDAFLYDALNRIYTAQAFSQPVEFFQYNEIGNILTKSSTANNGTYDYGPYGPAAVGPHAVKGIAGLGSYQYDVNGNMTSAPGASTMSWTSFDMPLVITKSTNTDAFVYGPNHERVKLTRNDGTTTYYAGMMETVIDAAANVTVKTYWPGGLGVDIDKGTATKTYWTPKDRLGSVMAYVDQTSAVVEQMDYDAWGRRRNTNGIGIPDTLKGVTDDKGFTGQEMLDNVQLVHLNGRVYDPLIGRFLSADPEVQAPEHSQSYNRYTYVWNNPTNMTDPTGFDACADGETCGGGTVSKASSLPPLANIDHVDVQTNPDHSKTVTIHQNNGNADFLTTVGGAATNSTVATGGSGPKPISSLNQAKYFSQQLANEASQAASMATPVAQFERYVLGRSSDFFEIPPEGKNAAMAATVVAMVGTGGEGIVPKVGEKLLAKGAEDLVERTAAEVLAANRVSGKAAESLAKTDLIAQGYKILGSQVSVQTSTGLRVIDHLVQSPTGQIIAIEVKSGNAVRNSFQLTKDAEIAARGLSSERMRLPPYEAKLYRCRPKRCVIKG